MAKAKEAAKQEGQQENKKEEKAPTIKILPCICVSSYQDKRYGTGMRVHNRAGRAAPYKYRCAVCAK
jgi:hypothetical protein